MPPLYCTSKLLLTVHTKIMALIIFKTAAAATQVGPASRSPLAAAPLAQQLDASWWAANTAAAAAALAGRTSSSSSGGDSSPKLEAPKDLTQQSSQQPVQFQWPQGDTSQQQQQEGGQQQQQSPRQEQQGSPQQQQLKQQQDAKAAGQGDRLLVAGLELPASLSKR